MIVDSNDQILKAIGRLEVAFHTIEKEVVELRTRTVSDSKHLRDLFIRDHSELKDRVDKHGIEIDQLRTEMAKGFSEVNLEIAKDKEATEASKRTTKLWGTILVSGFIMVEALAVIIKLWR